MRKKDRMRLRNCSNARVLVDTALAMAEARGDRMAVANLRLTQILMEAQMNPKVIPIADPLSLLGGDQLPTQYPTSSLIITNPKGGRV